MTLLYTDPRFLDHDTRRGHPERAERLRAITAHFDATWLAAECARPTWQPAARDRILRVHGSAYVESIADLAAHGGGRPEPDTVVGPASFEVASLAAGAAGDAVDRVLAGEDRTALCLVRPPGHHALPDHAMGFCLLNNVAIAAHVALDEHAVERVLIFSAHRWPFYPGTGAADETGTGGGLGSTCNLPLEFGTLRATYRDRFRRELEEFAARIRPQLVLVSAGFDAHRADPIGSLGLEVEDFAELTQMVVDVAAVHAEGRVVSLLEGGYNPPVLAECVATHLRGLLGAE